MVYKKHILFICLLFSSAFSFSAVLLTGDDSAVTGESISKAIAVHADAGQDGLLFIGAKETGLKEFALSGAGRENTALTGIAFKEVILNNMPDSANPLFDAAFDHLVLLGVGHKPVVVKNGDRNSLFLVDDFRTEKTAKLFSITGIQDATGTADASAIVRLTTAGEHHIFAAIAPGGGVFGGINSGIALVVKTQEKITEGDTQKTVPVLKQIDAVAGVVQADPKAATLGVADPKASPALRFTAGDNLAAISSSIVDMHWDAGLKRLYVALSVTAGADASSGARAIAVGRFTSAGALVFEPIAPDAALAGTNKIVGATGSGVEVAIYKVKVMHTSTGLSYLIVVGGSPDNSQQQVFALPLVNKKSLEGVIVGVPETDEPVHGTIANKNSTPTEVLKIDSKNYQRFAGRAITESATLAAHMPIATDMAARVGYGLVQGGVINDILVRGDTVFVSIFDDSQQSPVKSGVFASQALFDATGKIKGWTNWQRVAGTTGEENLFGIGLDNKQGTFFLLSGDDADSVRTIKRTEWKTGDSDGLLQVSELLGSEFPKEIAGVQGLVDVDRNYTDALDDLSVLVATGLHKVVLIETAQEQGISNELCPNFGDFSTGKVQFTNGTITQDVMNAKCVTIEGGTLIDCGALVTAAIVEQAEKGYLFVGGTDGIAVLLKPSGDGWDASGGGLLAGFDRLTDGMEFKKLGSYSLVTKIVADDSRGFIYILTNNTLDRIDISASDFVTGQLAITTLATIKTVPGLNLPGGFLDVVITQDKLALLATSAGVFRVGNGNNIATAASAAAVNWTPVLLQTNIVDMSKLVATAPMHNPVQVARDGGGHVYVLNAYQGQNQSQLYRLTIADLESTEIDDNSVQLVPDIMVGGAPDLNSDGAPIPSYFQRYGEYRNCFLTDGQLNVTARDRDAAQAPNIQSRSLGGRFFLPLALEQASEISEIIKLSTSGSWLVSGDFGLQIQE